MKQKPIIFFFMFFLLIPLHIMPNEHEHIFLSDSDLKILNEQLNHSLVYINRSVRNNILKIHELLPDYAWSNQCKQICLSIHNEATVDLYQHIDQTINECMEACNHISHDESINIKKNLNQYQEKLHAGKRYLHFDENDQPQTIRKLEKIYRLSVGYLAVNAGLFIEGNANLFVHGIDYSDMNALVAALRAAGLGNVTNTNTSSCNNALARFDGTSNTTINNAPLRSDNVSGTQTTSPLLADDCITTTLNLALIPKGGGALTAAIPDDTIIGGNARGTNAVDWQIIRSNSTQVASGLSSVLSGGQNNTASGDQSTIGGGQTNIASGVWSTISGGGGNQATDFAAVVAGGQNNNATLLAAICGGQNNNASGIFSLVGGGQGNTVSAVFSTIVGGQDHIITGSFATIGGGQINRALSDAATVSGGISNIAIGNNSTISGGNSNQTTGDFSTISGGSLGIASANYSTVSGGDNNNAAGDYSVVSGGEINIITGNYATIPGGKTNQANGDYSFAAGFDAIATGTGSFVWADSSGTPFEGVTDNSFNVRASGGSNIYTNSGLTAGVTLTAGGSAWVAVSDRHRKENFNDVDTVEILNKLVNIPIQSWNYKEQDQSIRHIGPMAQDFNPAFDFNETPLGISTLDFDGVALASIQGLYKLHTLEMSAMKNRMNELEEMIRQLTKQ